MLLFYTIFNQYALQHHKAATNEVHLIFDKPAQYFNPKQFEEVRCSKTKALNGNHKQIGFTPDTDISKRWREYTEYRSWKQSTVQAIGFSFLQICHLLLTRNRRLDI